MYRIVLMILPINHEFMDIKIFKIILAVFLLIIGLPSYIITLRILKTAYQKQVILTTGFFSICRNPLFTEVIFFIIPGILLFFNSLLLLTIPCFIYVMFKVFIHREENFLEKTFGKEYIDYKKNTTAIFPKIWKYKK
jgi:protein-S-isoprenylcysteine O-methyltransferase Ste14